MGVPTQRHQMKAKTEPMPIPKRPIPENQILKIREMREILEFELGKSESGEVTLKPIESAQGFEKEIYYAPELRKEIEPWLTALFQSEHFSLLTGAGLTNAVHHSVTGKLPVGFSNRTYAVFDKQIQAEAKRSAEVVGRGDLNPEDQLRTALIIADGLRILTQEQSDEEPWTTLKTNHSALETDIAEAIESLVKGVLSAEKGVTAQNEKRDEALRLLVSFLMSFASRTGTRDRLHIFTTNYDRLIEFGAEMAGMRRLWSFAPGSTEKAF